MPDTRPLKHQQGKHKFAVGAALLIIVIAAGVQIILRNRDVTGAKSAADVRTSLAILPFTNMSGKPEDEYFIDGVMEDLLTQVSKIRGLHVISRTTVMRYKGTSKSLTQIGDELGVGLILEGSVRSDATRIRVTTQLIEVQTDRHIWAEVYDRDLNDVFAIQSDLARSISGALRGTLPDIGSASGATLTQNLSAYKLFLKARYLWRQRTTGSLLEATEYLHHAVEIDTGFSLAYVGLADCYSLFPFYEIHSLSQEEAYKRAGYYASKALRLDPSLAEAHASMGNVQKESKWDWRSAEQEFRKAIDLDENYATAHQWYSECLRTQGRMPEAIAEGRKAFDLEPYSPIIGNIYGAALLYHHEYDASIPIFKKVLEVDPDAPFARLNLGWAYRFKGMTREAASEFALAGVPAEKIDLFTSASTTRAVTSLSDSALHALPPREKEYYIHAFALHNDKDRAMALLEQLVTERWPNTQFLIRHPALIALQSDERFRKLILSMGLDS